MPCYHPKIRIENKHKLVTAADGHKYHPAVIEEPDDIYFRIEQIKNHPWYDYQIIPCRNCIGCRLEYSREWANRGYLESLKSEHNYFVTLTYSDDNLKFYDELTTSDGITYADYDNSWNGTLVPEELTNFIKRFRKELTKKGIAEWKYMACGEYGGKTQRPHYHMILFNCPLPIESFYNPKIINKEVYFQNKIIEKEWTLGISNITEASWETIAYVARYITKKVNGKTSEDHYCSQGQEKEFFRVSKGLGRDYYERNKHKIYDTDEIIIKNRKGGHSIKPPKYFDDLYKKENPTAFDVIKKKRQKLQKDSEAVKDTTFSTGRLENLLIREKSHEEKNTRLIRSLDKPSDY